MKRAFGLLAIVVVVLIAWAGWREYDYRAAVAEAKSLRSAGVRWECREPWELIRYDWRLAFKMETWERKAALKFEYTPNFAQYLPLIRRLNPEEIAARGSNDLALFQGLTNLKRLGISSNDTLRDLSGLGNLPCLEELDVFDCPALEDLSAVSELRTLRGMMISGCPALQSLRGINGLPEFQGIALSGFTGELDFRDLPKVSRLFISGCPRLRDFRSLGALTGLQSLDVRDCPIENLDGLANPNLLRELTVKWCQELANVDGLKTMPDLEELALDDCRGLRSFEGLRGVSKLRKLYLNQCQDLRDLDVIGGCTELRMLAIGGSPKLENFEAVWNLKKIKSLDLAECEHFSGALFRRLTAALPEAEIDSPAIEEPAPAGE